MRRHLLSGISLVGFATPLLAQPWAAVVLHPEGSRSSSVEDVRADVQVGNSTLLNGQPQGGLWRGRASTWTPLADAAPVSYVLGLDGDQQVGVVSVRAALWRGTPESRIDLNPPGAYGSGALKVCGNMQVGELLFPGSRHAGLWHGTPESFVDLHPAGAAESTALATDGILQGGAVRWTNRMRAAIWNGTRESVVDLGVGEGDSWVLGMAPGVQVGRFYLLGTHAALWRGTPESLVDLSPPGASTSMLYGTTGRIHVGRFPQGGAVRAGINFGTPQSWLGLHQFLPAPYGSYSEARAVYQDGPRIYVGGWAENSNTGYQEAILWIGADPCYANCDGSTASPALNVNDFVCFLNKYAEGDPYANCDESTAAPKLNVNDFICFMGKFAAGCP